LRCPNTAIFSRPLWVPPLYANGQKTKEGRQRHKKARKWKITGIGHSGTFQSSKAALQIKHPRLVTYTALAHLGFCSDAVSIYDNVLYHIDNQPISRPCAVEKSS
jgi:hypothetical protein